MNNITPILSPSVADVERISAIRNTIIRNLEITECYAALSEAMQPRTGNAANWCTFATWASRQAGSTIRGEDLLEGLEIKLGKNASWLEPLQSLNRALLRKGLFSPETKFGKIVREIHTPFDAFERASTAVTEGNLKVFTEIGLEFARFLTSVPVDASGDSAEVKAFISTLKPGPPPSGQDLLKDAFICYQRQHHESDPAIRASWILLANLKIGLHEQTRLQPQINEAISAPLETFEDLGKRLLHLMIPASRLWPRFIHLPLIKTLNWLAGKIRKAAIKISHEAITESMMVLALPHLVLSLGKNLEAAIPEVFRKTELPELKTLLNEFDPCPEGIGNCAAEDWGNLRQRMHYIIHLFRSFAFDNSLFLKPFSKNQVTSFRKGMIPGGNLSGLL